MSAITTAADWIKKSVATMESLDDNNISVDSRAILTVPDMNYELRRLETFRFWPSDAPVDFRRIAKAGFYSTGNDLEVKCFSCGRSISEWNYNDQVMARHRILSPDCAFVKNPLECENVPLLPSVGSQADYRKEVDRLASFRGWPSPHVTPRSLARNGLYYLREGDKVACAFCSVELHEWQANDNPLEEHRRASPNCPMLFGYNVGNVPLDHTGSGIIEGEESTELQDVGDIAPRSRSSEGSPEPPIEIRPFSCYEGNMASNKNLATNPQFGAQAHRPPIHPRYQTYEARLSSFTDWPPNTIPTPVSLAEAGFYYQGTGDSACCFHCNGGLHNWDPNDDPWEEHARWFSLCPFVGIIKGQEFIRQAISKKPPNMPIAQMNELIRNSMSASNSNIEPSHTSEVNGAESSTGTASGSPLQAEEDITGIWQQQVEEERTQSSSNEAQATSGAISQEASAEAHLNRLSAPPEISASSELPEMLEKITLNPQDQSTNPEELAEENRRLTEARLCKVCLDEDVSIVFLPCGHLITCVKCAPNLAQCPMCRERIQAVVRTYFS